MFAGRSLLYTLYINTMLLKVTMSCTFSESRHVDCGDNDWKRKGVGGSDGEEEGGGVVCAGDPVEGE